MVWNLLSAFSVSALILWTASLIHEQGSEDAREAGGNHEPVCGLHDWSPIGNSGCICRRCRRTAE